MRTFAAFSLFFVVGALPAMADQASHRAAVEDLLLSVKADRVPENYLQILKASFAQGFQKGGGTAAQSAVFDKYWSEADALLRTELTWPKMKPEVVDIYAKAFTEEEARTLTAFYRSPVGQKALEQMPLLSQQTAEVGKAHLKAIQAQMQAIADRMMAELRPKP
ncbi:MAG: DUF2059 domain-containing protein [Acidobacteria bacterium]|nr:DUF2059 domain-containing protein [Acidobacteriota bacterium]